ncbi:MAG: ATP-dependent helicase [Lachnospiraceae bacterium]|nr:ATP-dependent helicase [Lachnospiraceae bacterium]
MNYNKSQQRAIRHKDGPMLVIAGPGSGKTSTLCQRVFNLVSEYGIPENKILVLTFTKKAATHMKERYEMLSKKPSQGRFSTIHSLCYSILSDYRQSKSINLISDTDRDKIIKRLIMDKFGIKDLDESMVHYICKLVYDMSLTVETGRKFNSDIISSGVFVSEEGLRFFYDAFQNYKRKYNLIDYDDMLYEVRRILINNKGILEKWQRSFSYILVDEYQDTNEVQFEIIRMLAEYSNNIFAVGDDDQSIYGFRGATPDIMKKFLSCFKDAETVYLDINYRSTPKIIAFCNKLITGSRERMPKVMKPVNENTGNVMIRVYKDQTDQYKKILSEMIKLGYEPRGTAVLFRTNMQKDEFLEEMALYPVLSGNEVCKRPEIYKRIAAFYRVLSKKYIAEDLALSMNLFGGNISPYLMPKRKEDLRCWPDICMSCNEEKEASEVNEYINMMDFCEKLNPRIAFLTIAGNKGFVKMIKSEFEEEVDFKRFFDELKNSINLLLEGCNSFFDAAVKIDKVESERKTFGLNSLNVLTMHESKGLEFDNVYIPDLNMGFMPINKASGENGIEEERRLLYVAMTRAKKNLMLSYFATANGRETKASGFIKELK